MKNSCINSIIGIKCGDKMAKEDKMIEATRAISARKVEQLKAAVDEMVSKGIAVTPYSVGKKTGLSKTFIYKNEEAKAYIEEHRSSERYNERKYERTEELEHQVKTLKREQTYAKKVTEEINNKLLQELIEENERLKEIVSKYEKLVEMGLLKIPDDMKL